MKRTRFLPVASILVSLHLCGALPGRCVASVPVCRARGDQTVIGLAPDGAGGALVTWMDERRGVDSADVYVQRITAAGEPAGGWPADGAAVCRAHGDQFVGGIVSDGAGGAIVAWDDGRVTKDRDIYAGRILADGSTPPGWPIDGVRLNAAGPEIKSGVLLVADSAGGAFVAWNDYSDRPSQGDVYAQHVLATGEVDPAWSEGGSVVCDEAGMQLVRAAVTDGRGGFYLFWGDHHPPLGAGRVFAQRMTAAGHPANDWPPCGKLACPSTGSQDQLGAAADGLGQVYFAWRDFRSDPNGDIFADHLPEADIEERWPRPIRTDTVGWMQTDPVVAMDGEGGIYVAYAEVPTDSYGLPSVHIQRVNANGTIAYPWPENPRPVGRQGDPGSTPRLAADGAGGVFIVWIDQENRGLSLRALHLSADGSPAAGWSEDGIVLARRAEFVHVPPILADGRGGAWIAWSDRDTEDVDVSIQHVTSDGQVLAGGESIPRSWPLLIFPNPTRGETTTMLDVSFSDRISVRLFDASGRLVRDLRDERHEPFAPLAVFWDGKDERGRRAPSGVYVLRVVAGNRNYAGTLAVIR